MDIKYKNKVRLAKYIKEHNGIEVDPNSIFDIQIKRLHEYKRQLMNILHVMYLYDRLKKRTRICRSTQEPSSLEQKLPQDMSVQKRSSN